MAYLNGSSVFMGSGRLDPAALPEDALELAPLFKKIGSDASVCFLASAKIGERGR
jgi:hypothetical protein